MAKYRWAPSRGRLAPSGGASLLESTFLHCCLLAALLVAPSRSACPALIIRFARMQILHILYWPARSATNWKSAHPCKRPQTPSCKSALMPEKRGGLTLPHFHSLGDGWRTIAASC
eukprot:scaffold137403_cov33-Tisochrysis_lutea.AAC.1